MVGYNETAWTPNKWLASFLSFFAQPLGLMYVGRWRLAILYLLMNLVIVCIELIRGGHFYFVLGLGTMCAVHTFWLAKNASPSNSRPWYGRWYGLVSVWIAVFLSVFTLRAFIIEPFSIPSTSMEPTLHKGQHALVSKIGYRHFGTYGITLSRYTPNKPITRGTLVVYEYSKQPSVMFVRRVIGVAGDVVGYKNKNFTINGVTVAQKEHVTAEGSHIIEEILDGITYQVLKNNDEPAQDFEIKVPSNHYFVIGDNRDESYDSRHHGAVRAEALVGNVVYVF